ncbi:hypothetical protein [Staphylococcus haemolyticus]|uniref:hypothetical protein n=1 Tax=Staphylococcus haemolyticus TaxID=1283 RepID=UPI0034D4572D
MKKEEIKNLILNNNWYTYEEAEQEIMLFNLNDDEEKKDYLNLTRRSIQKIIRSDVLGQFYKIDKKSNTDNENKLNLNKIYGWTEEKEVHLEKYDKITNDYYEENFVEKLKVFPKYDDFFPKQNKSIILSFLDEQLNNKENLEIREMFEKIYKINMVGRTPYLMTEPYLYALKLEIERRNYPSKNIQITPVSPKEIKSRLKKANDFRTVVTEVLNEFQEFIKENENRYIKAKKENLRKYDNIQRFFSLKEIAYTTEINEVINCLSEMEYMDKFNQLYSKLGDIIQHSRFLLDINKKYMHIIEKSKKYNSTHEKYAYISRSIYAYQIYSLDKYEEYYSEEKKLIAECDLFREDFTNTIIKCIKNLNSINKESLLNSFKIKNY